MASVIDLYTELSKMRGLDFGELRHLVRTLQDAELLPKATRRQLRSPPSLDSRDAAIFLIALGTSRSSGARTSSELRRRVNRFKKLVTAEGVEGQESTLFADLVRLIDRHRDTAWVADKDRSWSFYRLLFVVDDRTPRVFIDLHSHQHPIDSQCPPKIFQLTYLTERELNRPSDDIDLDRDEFCAPAYMFEHGIFFRLCALLGPLEPQEAVG